MYTLPLKNILTIVILHSNNHETYSRLKNAYKSIYTDSFPHMQVCISEYIHSYICIHFIHLKIIYHHTYAFYC